jgi:hypothetical protein
MVHGGGDADGDRGSGRAHNPNCNREYEAVATICGVCGWVATKGCRLWAGDRTAMIVDDRSESDTHLSESGPCKELNTRPSLEWAMSQPFRPTTHAHNACR